MRRAVLLGLLLLGAADKLPPPQDSAHLPRLSAAEQAARDMLKIYDEFCLQRFPNAELVRAGIAARRLNAASAADAAESLQGRPGQAWAVSGVGTYTLAFADAPHQGCVVTGAVADDESLRAIFGLAVQAFASEHDLGKLDTPMLRHGSVGNAPAVMQVIGTTGGAARQAFVNLSWVADGVVHGRLAREFPPPGK
jgi:hypothetical protein